MNVRDRASQPSPFLLQQGFPQKKANTRVRAPPRFAHINIITNPRPFVKSYHKKNRDFSLSFSCGFQLLKIINFLAKSFQINDKSPTAFRNRFLSRAVKSQSVLLNPRIKSVSTPYELRALFIRHTQGVRGLSHQLSFLLFYILFAL
jgi:hypothetical protein